MFWAVLVLFGFCSDWRMAQLKLLTVFLATFSWANMLKSVLSCVPFIASFKLLTNDCFLVVKYCLWIKGLTWLCEASKETSIIYLTCFIFWDKLMWPSLASSHSPYNTYRHVVIVLGIFVVLYCCTSFIDMTLHNHAIVCLTKQVWLSDVVDLEKGAQGRRPVP